MHEAEEEDGFCEEEINPGPLTRSPPPAALRELRGTPTSRLRWDRGVGGCGHVSEHPREDREGEHGQADLSHPSFGARPKGPQCTCCQSRTPSDRPVPKVSATWRGRPLPGAWSGQHDPPRTSHAVGPWEKPAIRAPRRRPGAALGAGCVASAVAAVTRVAGSRIPDGPRASACSVSRPTECE